MNDDIKAICLVSMFSGIVGAAIPSGRMKSAFSSFSAIVVVFCMLSPLARVKADSFGYVTFDSKENEKLISDVRSAEVMLYEELIEDAIEEKLMQDGLEVSVDAVCERDADDFRLLSVTVSAKNEEDFKTAEKLLQESFPGITVASKEENYE